jgi:hypothetical protein
MNQLQIFPILLLTFGGMCMLAQNRGGACFCTRGAMQGYDGYYLIVALAKTVTPGGSPRRQPGRAAPLTTKRSSLARKFSRCGEANCIYRPVSKRIYYEDKELH